MGSIGAVRVPARKEIGNRASGLDHSPILSMPVLESKWLGMASLKSLTSLSHLPFFIALIIIFSLGPLSALRCNELLVLVIAKANHWCSQAHLENSNCNEQRIYSFFLLTFCEAIGVVDWVNIFLKYASHFSHCCIPCCFS